MSKDKKRYFHSTKTAARKRRTSARLTCNWLTTRMLVLPFTERTEYLLQDNPKTQVRLQWASHIAISNLPPPLQKNPKTKTKTNKEKHTWYLWLTHQTFVCLALVITSILFSRPTISHGSQYWQTMKLRHGHRTRATSCAQSLRNVAKMIINNPKSCYKISFSKNIRLCLICGLK